MGVLNDNLQVNGALSATFLYIPAGTITDAMVNALASIAATKLQHQHRKTYVQGNDATTAAAESKVIHSVYGSAGSVIAFRAGCVTPCIGAATITVDLKKNGTTILSAPIGLSSAQTARQLVAGTVTVPALVANDVLEIIVTATAGGGTIGAGLFGEVTINENPA